MKSSTFSKIRELAELSKSTGVIDSEDLTTYFVLNSGANETEMSECLAYTQNTLPADYQLFLREFNGAVFYQYEDLGGFEFLSCAGLITETKVQKETYEEYWDDRILPFCLCLGDGDYLGFKISTEGEYQILDCYHDDHPTNWKVISYSLDGFINELIKQKGRKFWLFQPIS